MNTPLSEQITKPIHVDGGWIINEIHIAPWVIDEVKKLEDQNTKMLQVLKIYAEGAHEIGTHYAENIVSEIEGEQQ